MNSPFLQEFLKGQGLLPGLRGKTPATMPKKDAPPATPIEAIKVPKDIKAIAKDKPSAKKVQDWFRERVKELEDEEC